jgi:DGQHR domain-containing protein
MLDKSRLNKISTFITRGGYFANNIILNFTHKPTFHRFEKEKQVGDLICGILEFPRQYASAWIIDGQHRLYGYADNPKKSESTVPVLAFESLDVREQAKLFVDINKEQRAVPANLLWDLYSDIYYDSLDKEHQLLRTISLLVKKLNSDSDSPLRDHVSIPSVTPKDRDATNLTIATICDALKESGLISAEDGLLYKTDYDSTVDFACEVIKVYFDMIANAFPEDWEKGDKGLLRTNIGVRILVIILRQLLKYLRFIGRGDIYIRDLKRFKEETQKYLSPMLSKVKEMSVEERDRIREASAKGLVANNAQQWAWLLEDTERRLRVFISQRLETVYGAKWFGRIDKEIRDYIQKKVEEEIARERWKESQLISLPPDKKMRFTTTGHLKKIIEDNWDAFEDLFLDKQFALAQFKSFVDLRHVYAHHREEECDIVVKNLGYWATRWIRKCIGLNKAEEAA